MYCIYLIIKISDTKTYLVSSYLFQTKSRRQVAKQDRAAEFLKKKKEFII